MLLQPANEDSSLEESEPASDAAPAAKASVNHTESGTVLVLLPRPEAGDALVTDDDFLTLTQPGDASALHLLTDALKGPRRLTPPEHKRKAIRTGVQRSSMPQGNESQARKRGRSKAPKSAWSRASNTGLFKTPEAERPNMAWGKEGAKTLEAGRPVATGARGSKAPNNVASRAQEAGGSRALEAGGPRTPEAGRSKATETGGSEATETGRSEATETGWSKATETGGSMTSFARGPKASKAVKVVGSQEIQARGLEDPDAKGSVQVKMAARKQAQAPGRKQRMIRRARSKEMEDDT